MKTLLLIALLLTLLIQPGPRNQPELRFFTSYIPGYITRPTPILVTLDDTDFTYGSCTPDLNQCLYHLNRPALEQLLTAHITAILYHGRIYYATPATAYQPLAPGIWLTTPNSDRAIQFDD
jgi:hypothetical protein